MTDLIIEKRSVGSVMDNNDIARIHGGFLWIKLNQNKKSPSTHWFQKFVNGRATDEVNFYVSDLPNDYRVGDMRTALT